MRRLLLLLALSLAFTSVSTHAANAETAESPWSALEEVRRTLARVGATGAEFDQTFVAAGFSSGDTENGRLAFSLPDCLRWDYSEPYPKSFLVCQDTAWYWNETDGTGRRQAIDSRNEPGLDLLLLSVDSLSERYEATSEAGEENSVLLTLKPKGDSSEIAEAWLTLDPNAGRVLRLEYRDREGNQTSFAIHGYQPLANGESFSPPASIAWEDG